MQKNIETMEPARNSRAGNITAHGSLLTANRIRPTKSAKTVEHPMGQ